MSSSVVRARAHCRARPKIKHRQVERLDRKLADAISSNIVQKCDVTLSRDIQPLRSEVLFCLSIIHGFCWFFVENNSLAITLA